MKQNKTNNSGDRLVICKIQLRLKRDKRGKRQEPKRGTKAMVMQEVKKAHDE